MNRTVTFLTALAAGFATQTVAGAQTAATPASAAPATASAAAPVALPAKIALVNFEQVVLASNEGQTVTANTQKKYEPKKNQIEAESAEVETLKKNLQALPASTPDDEKASRVRAIDTKEKQLNRDAEDANTAYNTEWQEALSKVAQKIAGTVRTYAQTNGYTLVLDLSNQQSNVLWAQQSTDISQAVLESYNKTSGVAAPPPSGPSARPSSAARPAARNPSK